MKPLQDDDKSGNWVISIILALITVIPATLGYLKSRSEAETNTSLSYSTLSEALKEVQVQTQLNQVEIAQMKGQLQGMHWHTGAVGAGASGVEASALTVGGGKAVLVFDGGTVPVTGPIQLAHPGSQFTKLPSTFSDLVQQKKGD